MKVIDTLEALEAVAAKKSIRIAYETLAGEVGAGGLCKIKGEYRIIVDKRTTPGERVAMIAQALAAFPLDDVYLAPELRELVGRFKKG